MMMVKVFKRLAVLAAVLTIPAGDALAQGGPPWGWRRAPPAYGYYSGVEVDRAKVDAAVKETLNKATKGQTWTTPSLAKMTPIPVDNHIVGQLWEDSDPKTLVMGSFWAGAWGVNVQLVKDGKVVGMLWVAKRGFVDHTQYDTTSILRFVTKRFAVPMLPGLLARDNALAANGSPPPGDLTNALDVPPQ
jgi:hypothetical protein